VFVTAISRAAIEMAEVPVSDDFMHTRVSGLKSIGTTQYFESAIMSAAQSRSNWLHLHDWQTDNVLNRFRKSTIGLYESSGTADSNKCAVAMPSTAATTRRVVNSRSGTQGWVSVLGETAQV